MFTYDTVMKAYSESLWYRKEKYTLDCFSSMIFLFYRIKPLHLINNKLYYMLLIEIMKGLFFFFLDMILYMNFVQHNCSKNSPMNVDDEFYFIKQ